MKSSKVTFENKISEINQEINKRRHKWNLTTLAWMDFNDVSQILRIHIYKKWNLYDPKKPLAPWVNRIVSNQIKNLIRNNYGNYSRPCLRCAAAEQEDGCTIYASQCNKCPLYAKWEKSKKSAHDIKLPVALENHTQEVHNIIEDEIDIEKTAQNIHTKMQQVLKPIEWKFYELYYIKHKSEEESAKLMGYKTTEKNRKIGYKQVKNLKKSIMTKVKKYLYNGDIDIH
ncbi:MAG: sigma-70 family RNA polymerase sigma factor [Caulobacteraceae bacterium]|nr:sigma-70 family RNA polymerase sigma factor [Caulobacteraceae bacterium]